MITVVVRGPPKSGKTTMAVRICALLKKSGERVRLVDCDPYEHRFDGQFEDPQPTVEVVTEMVCYETGRPQTGRAS